MKKHHLVALFVFLNFNLSFGQTIEDIKKLGLTDSQLRTSFEKRQIRLTAKSGKKTKKIKEGAFATVKMKGDTSMMPVVLEAFLADTIIVSSLLPQLNNKEIKLSFTEFKLLPLSDIESIQYSVRHRGITFWTGFVLYIVGAELVILPTIMPLILGNADEIYSQPSFPYEIGAGVILFFIGVKMLKSTKPKMYNLSDWNYSVVKK